MQQKIEKRISSVSRKKKIAQGDDSIFSHLTFAASQQYFATHYLSTPARCIDNALCSSLHSLFEIKTMTIKHLFHKLEVIRNKNLTQSFISEESPVSMHLLL